MLQSCRYELIVDAASRNDTGLWNKHDADNSIENNFVAHCSQGDAFGVAFGQRIRHG